jgi:hypothetical protein
MDGVTDQLNPRFVSSFKTIHLIFTRQLVEQPKIFCLVPACKTIDIILVAGIVDARPARRA